MSAWQLAHSKLTSSIFSPWHCKHSRSTRNLFKHFLANHSTHVEFIACVLSLDCLVRYKSFTHLKGHTLRLRTYNQALAWLVNGLRGFPLPWNKLIVYLASLQRHHNFKLYIYRVPLKQNTLSDAVSKTRMKYLRLLSGEGIRDPFTISRNQAR